MTTRVVVEVPVDQEPRILDLKEERLGELIKIRPTVQWYYRGHDLYVWRDTSDQLREGMTDLDRRPIHTSRRGTLGFVQPVGTFYVLAGRGRDLSPEVCELLIGAFQRTTEERLKDEIRYWVAGRVSEKPPNLLDLSLMVAAEDWIKEHP
jgi:hypothetical protein